MYSFSLELANSLYLVTLHNITPIKKRPPYSDGLFIIRHRASFPLSQYNRRWGA